VLWPAGHDVAADMLGDAGVTVICKPVAAAALLDALEACLQPVHAPRAAVPAAAG